MKLKYLKIGQQFTFVTGTNRTKYEIISAYPRCIYRALNGIIEYRAERNSRLFREVELLNMPELTENLEFIDEDGNKMAFTTAECEANFFLLNVQYEDFKSTGGLTRQETIELINWLQRWLLIKD